MNNSSRHLADASVDVDEQLNQLTVQLARGILTASRRIFAIAEWSAENSEFRWPWSSSTNQSGPRGDHWRLLHRLLLKLPSNGVWCVVDKASDGSVQAVVRPNNREIKPLAPSQQHNRNLVIGSLEKELGALILRADEREICRLVSVLGNEYDWIGFYIRQLDLLDLSVLLRHCELAYVAANAPAELEPKHQRVFKSWMEAKVPLKGVFKVIAS